MELLLIGFINLAVGIAVGYFINRWDKKKQRERFDALLDKHISRLENEYEENRKILKDIGVDQK